MEDARAGDLFYEFRIPKRDKEHSRDTKNESRARGPFSPRFVFPPQIRERHEYAGSKTKKGAPSCREKKCYKIRRKKHPNTNCSGPVEQVLPVSHNKNVGRVERRKEHQS